MTFNQSPSSPHLFKASIPQTKTKIHIPALLISPYNLPIVSGKSSKRKTKTNNQLINSLICLATLFVNSKPHKTLLKSIPPLSKIKKMICPLFQLHTSKLPWRTKNWDLHWRILLHRWQKGRKNQEWKQWKRIHIWPLGQWQRADSVTLQD